jgi:hypothetical protein
MDSSNFFLFFTLKGSLDIAFKFQKYILYYKTNFNKTSFALNYFVT